jgi:hypothetical protein
MLPVSKAWHNNTLYIRLDTRPRLAILRGGCWEQWAQIARLYSRYNLSRLDVTVVLDDYGKELDLQVRRRIVTAYGFGE